MKIGKIMAKNFAKVDTISVNIDPTRTYFVGTNAAGKSTMGYSVPLFVMKGLSQRGDGLIAERFRFIGAKGKSAEGEIEIIDEKEGVTHTATRKLLKSGTNLKIVSSDGVVRGQEFLDSLWSAILFNVMKFSELTGKEQALSFGVDTTELDKQRKALEADRLAIYQDLNRLKGVAETSMGAEKVEEISLSDLLGQRKQIELHNIGVKQHEAECQRMFDRKQGLEEEVEKRKIALQIATTALNEIKETIDNTTIPDLPKDTNIIDEKIQGAEDINTQARAYKDSLEDQKKANAEQAKYDAKNGEISAVDVQRTEHIKGSKLPYKNTTINEDGNFELNGKLFSSTYFSLGERMKFGAMLACKIMEGQSDRDELLEYVYIPHAESLDPENREKLFKELADLGLQVVAEYVDTKKQAEVHSILLKQCKVVESYKDEKKGEKLT